MEELKLLKTLKVPKGREESFNCLKHWEKYLKHFTKEDSFKTRVQAVIIHTRGKGVRIGYHYHEVVFVDTGKIGSIWGEIAIRYEEGHEVRYLPRKFRVDKERILKLDFDEQ